MSTQTTPNLERLSIQLNRVLLARDGFIREALTFGQMLMEERHLLSSSHSGKRSWNDGTKPGEDQFAVLIETEFNLTRTTAYRWMDAADRVALAVFPGRTLNQTDAGLINIEDELVPISKLLTTADSELMPAQLTAKSKWLNFISEKSMRQILAVVCTEGGDAHGITRSHNGRTKGGKGNVDRKDWPYFMAERFKDLSSHFAKWESMNEMQRTEAKATLRSAIMGEEMKLSDKRGIFNYETPWPRELAEFGVEVFRERLKGQ